MLRPNGPDIGSLSPKLKKQWDTVKNAHLEGKVVLPNSSCIVWWKCDGCPDGHPHEWEAPVSRRTVTDGCPFCKGRRVCAHSSLATVAPDVAASWVDDDNIGTPKDYTANSMHKAQWQCLSCAGQWSTTIQMRVGRQSGCPHCYNLRRGRKKDGTQRTSHSSLAESNHPGMSEWDSAANDAESLFPDEIKLRSSRLVNWVCRKCPMGCLHRFQSSPNLHLYRGSGCPICTGKKACKCNSLQSLFPDISLEWDSVRNHGQPSDYTSKSNVVVWWKSKARGSWQQAIDTRTDSRLIRNQ